MEEKKGEEGDSGREQEGVGIKEALRSRKGARWGRNDPLPPPINYFDSYSIQNI